MISCKNSKNSKKQQKTAKSAGSRRGCFGMPPPVGRSFQPGGEILLQIRCRCSDGRSTMQLPRALYVERIGGDSPPGATAGMTGSTSGVLAQKMLAEAVGRCLGCEDGSLDPRRLRSAGPVLRDAARLGEPCHARASLLPVDRRAQRARRRRQRRALQPGYYLHGLFGCPNDRPNPAVRRPAANPDRPRSGATSSAGSSNGSPRSTCCSTTSTTTSTCCATAWSRPS